MLPGGLRRRVPARDLRRRPLRCGPRPDPNAAHPARVRSHCRFRDRGTEYASEPGVKWRSDGTKRQCGRALTRLPAGRQTPGTISSRSASRRTTCPSRPTVANTGPARGLRSGQHLPRRAGRTRRLGPRCRHPPARAHTFPPQIAPDVCCARACVDLVSLFCDAVCVCVCCGYLCSLCSLRPPAPLPPARAGATSTLRTATENRRSPGCSRTSRSGPAQGG